MGIRINWNHVGESDDGDSFSLIYKLDSHFVEIVPKAKTIL